MNVHRHQNCENKQRMEWRFLKSEFLRRNVGVCASFIVIFFSTISASENKSEENIFSWGRINAAGFSYKSTMLATGNAVIT